MMLRSDQPGRSAVIDGVDKEKVFTDPSKGSWRVTWSDGTVQHRVPSRNVPKDVRIDGWRRINA